MSRSTLKPALLVSLALHAGLAAYVLTRPRPPPLAPEPEWVVVEVAPALPPPAAVPSPAPPQPPRPPLKKKGPTAKAAEVAAPSPAPPDEALAAAAGAAPSVSPSRPLSLFPQLDLQTGGELAEAPRGRTVRPDDPEFRPEVLRAEAEHRVKQRVDGWADDQLAEARAQTGLPHPYFSGLHDAAKTGLARRAGEAHLGATTAQALQAVGKRYEAATSSYAKTGNPNLGPEGNAPRQSELLKDRMGNMPETIALRALVQATETQNDLSHGKPLVSLTLEVRQFRDSSPLTAVVLQASGDPKFDLFVLDAWPKTIAEAGPPPPDAFHGPMLRSVWAIEGWLGLPKKLEGAVSYLPMPGVLGVSAEKLLPALTEDGYHYEFNARLLRVYQ